MQKRAHQRLRAQRTRTRLHGTHTCPRLTVKRSLKHIYVQLVDDDVGRTLASASDRDVSFGGKPLAVAREVGMVLGKKALALGVTKTVFDRGSYRYHGRVAAIANGAREAGLTL